MMVIVNIQLFARRKQLLSLLGPLARSTRSRSTLEFGECDRRLCYSNKADHNTTLNASRWFGMFATVVISLRNQYFRPAVVTLVPGRSVCI